MKDHYRTLGIPSSASIAEIKKAYRALAFKYHPDKNPDNSLSEAQFKEIQEAYATLSDSNKRTAYDDERWLRGMGGKTKQAEVITPAWLLNVCMQLNASLATMDTHRMSQHALEQYILLILEDAHLAILLQAQETTLNHTIIRELLKSSKKLDVKRLGEIERKLIVLAADDKEMFAAIDQQMEERIRKAQWDRLLPYVVIVITLALCVLMYFYSSTS